MFWAGFRMLSVKKSGGALPPLMKNKVGDVPPPPPSLNLHPVKWYLLYYKVGDIRAFPNPGHCRRTSILAALGMQVLDVFMKFTTYDLDAEHGFIYEQIYSVLADLNCMPDNHEG